MQEPTKNDEGLLNRVSLVEAQPLPEQAAGFEQLADELLEELQRSDQDPRQGSA